jgi:hypothetical protein
MSVCWRESPEEGPWSGHLEKATGRGPQQGIRSRGSPGGSPGGPVEWSHGDGPRSGPL